MFDPEFAARPLDALFQLVSLFIVASPAWAGAAIPGIEDSDCLIIFAMTFPGRVCREVPE